MLKENVLVFGTGSLYLENRGKIKNKYNVMSLIDNDFRKHGTYIDDMEILSPEKINEFYYDFIIISSSYESDIFFQLIKLGVPKEKVIFLRFAINSESASVFSHLLTSGVFYQSTGITGENLSIVILSYNRVDMTIRLLSSIEKYMNDFLGEIIVFDNGSKSSELVKLNLYLRNYPLSYSLIESSDNLGVAKGRNRAMLHARNDWVFFIDNDIFFIENPLPRIDETILKFNSPYINLPLLNNDLETICSFGGNITLDHGYLSVVPFMNEGSSRLFVDTIMESKISFGSFLFGGSSVYHKDNFMRMGGFDESLFIGFEDLIFSMLLIKSGVRVANISDFYMVHDHARPSDYEYNNVRYDIKTIKNSADTAFSKYGVNMYSDDVEKWLQSRTKKVI
jgi:GT2 family glycosyltransferase